MERVRRLQQLWSWLPAFRAVAETEHLPTASEQLHVTPPALSRSIKQLEDNLQTPLFDRVGRRLRLNAAGRELLSAVRDAMRRLDDGVVAISGEQMVGPLSIAAPMPFLSLLVLPAFEVMLAQHPKITPHLSSVGARAGNARLLRGEIDLVLVDDPIVHEDLSIERLAPISYGLYCGVGHPLADAVQVTHSDLTPHAFAAPPEGFDHWPPGLSRHVGIVISHLHLGAEVCASGRYLAVLPDLVAEHHPQSAELRRLPFEAFPFDAFDGSALYAVRRPVLAPGVVDTFLSALRARLAALTT